jgi:hypothetical protein
MNQKELAFLAFHPLAWPHMRCRVYDVCDKCYQAFTPEAVAWYENTRHAFPATTYALTADQHAQREQLQKGLYARFLKTNV